MPYITTDKVKAIREEIKKAFPEFKFSITRRNRSSIVVDVLSGPIELLDSDRKESGYEGVNQYHIKDTGAKGDFLRKLAEIINRDVKIVSEDGDYGFIPNFYTDIGIGQWNKPYMVTERKFVSTENTFDLPESTPELDGLRKLKNDMAVAKFNFENNNRMKKIKARFGSKCAETGLYISKGEEMYYDYQFKKCYSSKSELFKKLEAEASGPADPGLAAMIQANEEAEFDRFIQNDKFSLN